MGTMATNSWMKTIHGSCCDGAALKRIVQTEMTTASVLRIMESAPRGDPLAHWADVGGCLGPAVNLGGYGAPGDWMDGGFEPNGRAVARPGDVIQPLHNESASVAALAESTALLYVARQGQGGGQSLFIDAGAVVDCVRRYDPLLHDRLFETPIAFGRSDGDAVVSPILRLQDGRLKIAWNDFRILPDQGEAVEETRRAFRLFLLDMTLSGDVAACKLQTGDAVFFRTDEVLQGRAAYAIRGAEESITWKAYFRPAEARAARAA